MKLLQERIIKDGTVLPGNILKVDSFLNHQIDVKLLIEIGNEFKKRFTEKRITKVLTVESSGIAVATVTAINFKVPVVFAKKGHSHNQDEKLYESEAYSFTKKQPYVMKVSKKYITSMDTVLIVDDFLANGEALKALIDICHQAKCKIAGVGIVIEKSFQPGREKIEKFGLKIESLARISKMKNGKVFFIV
ncbi:MAG: xanthine phosphoribosyltransferase [Clostridiales bacterium]|nr:xanthine phosphoribosyltransferase [Clostridiales bacterium]